MMKNLNVLFLDIDGVLIAGHDRVIHGFTDFSPHCVESFKKIIRGVKNLEIVISSAHRYGLAAFRLGALWERHGLDRNIVISATAKNEDDRGKQILDWLAAKDVMIKHSFWWEEQYLPREVVKFAILDDDTKDIRPHFQNQNVIFETQFISGLTTEIASDIIKFFNEPAKEIS